MSTQESASSLTNDPTERRREPRYEVGAAAILRKKSDQNSYAAVTLNSSSAGLLLQVSEDHPFNVGDEVVCEIALEDAPDRAFASWGVGRVVRCDRSNAAIELTAAVFTAADKKS